MERPGRGLSRALAALGFRDFRLLLLSAIGSGMADQLQTVSNLWQIYALTASPLHLGLNGLARAVPIILFSLAGGVVADRVDRRKILVSAQTGAGVVAVGLGILSATGLVEVWHIYTATAVGAALNSFSNPARRAVIATVVPRYQLMNAMALNMTVHQTDRIIAPAVAGILIALVGLPVTYAVNGLANFLAAGTVGRVALAPLAGRPHESPLRSLVEGLAYVRVRSVILALLATDAAAMLFGSYQVLLPIFADQFGLGSVGYGLLQSAPAAGALIGAGVIMSLGDIRYKGLLIIGAILGYCCCLVVLAVTPWFGLALLVAAGLGLTNSMQATPRNAVIQLVTPDELRGRVSSFQQMLISGGPALGQGLMGGATGLLGGPFALILGAVLCAAINVGILIGRRDLRARDLGAMPAPAALATTAAAPAPGV